MNDEITISRRSQKIIIVCLFIASFIIGIVGTCVFFDPALDVFGLFFSLIVSFFIILSAAVLMLIKVYEKHSSDDDLDKFENVYYDDSEDTFEDCIDDDPNKVFNDDSVPNSDAFPDSSPDEFPNNESDKYSDVPIIKGTVDNPE